MKTIVAFVLGIALGSGAFMLASCARLAFSDGWASNGAHFFDPSPYLLVTVSKDCTTNASVIAFPGSPRTVSFNSGYGSANLSASFQNGMLSSVGQQTDPKVPETLTALTGLAKLAAPGFAQTAPAPCAAKAILFQIHDGKIDTTQPIQLLVD